MITLDGVNVFGSGPSEIVLGSWQRQQITRGVPGRDGELVLDLGCRGRTIRQSGRLQAATPGELELLVQQVTAFQDGAAHVLVDSCGLEYPNLVVQSFELTTAITLGRGAWADYQAEYIQRP